MKRILLFSLYLLLAVAHSPRPASAEWNVTAALPLSAGYVAVNSVTNRVYVSTPEGIHVLDGLTHETLHTIPMDELVHIAVDETHNRLFLSGSELTQVDAATNTILRSTPLDANQHFGRAYDPGSNRYYLTDRGCSFSPDCKSFVAGYYPNALEIHHWITTPHIPRDVVADPNHHTVYVSYATVPSIARIINIDFIIQEIAVEGVVAQLALDPNTRTLYALEQGGKFLTVIDTAQNEVTGRYDLTSGLQGETVESMALNPATGEIAFYARTNRHDFPFDNSLNRWSGKTALSSEGVPALQYDARIELVRPLRRPLIFPSSGMAYNPTTGRLYLNYGEALFSPEQNRLLVVEDAPPVDSVPPTVSVTVSEPPNDAGWYRSEVWATITAKDNLNGFGVDAVTLRGVSREGTPSPQTSQVHIGESVSVRITAPSPSTSPTPEPWWLEYTARDFAGNETTGRFTLKIDLTRPMTTPRFTGASGGLTHVVLEAEDMGGSGVASIWYHLDGGPLTLYTGPFTVSGDRTHEMRVFARDIAGNVEAPKDVRIHLPGDLNGDLRVDVADVVHLLQAVVAGRTPTPQELGAGDRDANGTLNVTDAVRLLQQIVNAS